MAGKNSVFVNNSTPNADDTWLNLQQNEGNNIILGSGQSLSDAISNQRVIGVSRFAANNFYTDSGAANAYVLTLAASMTNPVSATVGYFVGMTIRFRAGNANTGASTVNVNSAGVKNLKQADGTTDLAAGDIPTTQDSEFRYNGTAFCLNSKVGYQLKSVQTFTSTGTWTKPAGINAVLVNLVGGGGGGGGSANGTNATNGGAGGTTSFGSHCSATGGNGGLKGTNSGGGNAVSGGSASGGTINFSGSGSGSGTAYSGNVGVGGIGGNSYFGGAGLGAVAAADGGNAGTNTGSGGGGGGAPAVIGAGGGGGGGAGGFSEKFITSGIGATETVTIGSAGANGAAGTSGFNGGSGAAGLVIVYEYV